LIQTALHLLAKPEDWRLPVITPLSKVGDIKAALAAQLPQPLRHPLFGMLAGEVRAAVAGADMALDVRVIDHDVRAGNLAWQGSCVEVFCAPVGVKGVNPTQPAKGIGQVMLVPAAGSSPARALYAQNGEHPAPDIRLACEPLPDGYRLLALIPLSRLGLAEGMETFTFQLVATATPEQGGRQARVPLFYCDAAAFATPMHHGFVKIHDS
jgi:hypothetical protein